MGKLEKALFLRQRAWRLRGAARDLDARYAATLIRVASDLEGEATEIERSVARIAALTE
jgi:hypothetical protein